MALLSLLRQAEDGPGELAVDEEAVAAGLGVGAHHRVEGRQQLVAPGPVPLVAAARVDVGGEPGVVSGWRSAGRTWRGPARPARRRRPAGWPTWCRRPPRGPRACRGSSRGPGSPGRSRRCATSWPGRPCRRWRAPRGSRRWTGSTGCASVTSPNWRAKSACWAGVRAWSRKKMTWCVLSACRTAATTSGSSGTERSTPEISAPMIGESGWTLTDGGERSPAPVCPTARQPLNPSPSRRRTLARDRRTTRAD